MGPFFLLSASSLYFFPYGIRPTFLVILTHMGEAMDKIPLPVLLKMRVFCPSTKVSSHCNKNPHSEEWETHSIERWEDLIINTLYALWEDLPHLLLSEAQLCLLGGSSLSLTLHNHLLCGCWIVCPPWRMYIFDDQFPIGANFRG